jgi:arylsulfatase A
VALFEETYSNHKEWAQRSVDLTSIAGETVRIALEIDDERSGAVALWSAPTLTGKRSTKMPNIIFYVIDGAGAEYMSLYGYNRRTTPNIDRLAAEGAVFERAYSNARWTRPSTASFMTSLQHSVLGGHDRGGFNVVPENILTMAQHLHRAGYQTGVFTPNPNAGKMSGLDREVDVFQEDWEDFTYGQSGHWREGSRYLHDAFWKWREAYPGEPYWVHFQPVDAHEDFPEVAPFGGLFVGLEQANTWLVWREKIWEQNVGVYSDAWEKIGVDRIDYYTVAQALYDEAMAFTDYQIGRLVDRLKAEGEWENTLLIVASDHSIDQAMQDTAVAFQNPLPLRWNRTWLRPSVSRIPLVFVWPGHIAGGQRFREPVVSMVDVLPTLLDLLNLPLPEVTQGQSLAPLLLGEGEVEPRPVILDEFWVVQNTGELRGRIEVIDGRWGASLEFNPRPPEEGEPEWRTLERRPVPLLLYDLWNDPYCLHSIHEERPDLVEKYTTFLEAQFEAHQALAKMFTPSKALPLTSEQLEALRALGYIR